MNLETVDAAEHDGLLPFLAASLQAYNGHPAYGLDQLRSDLDRFALLLGGNDGEPLFQPDP